MKLIDDHKIKGVGGKYWVRAELVALASQRLNRGKDMLPLLRLMPAHQKFTKRPVAQHGAKGIEALREDIFAMRNKEQRCLGIFRIPARKIERGDHRLAGPGRRHHEVSESPVALTLHVQCL